MKRQQFLKQSAILGTSLFLSPQLFSQENPKVLFTEDEIYEFVAAAHASLEKTQKIVEEKPLIINATNQFVKGDFETAIGGASHMGRKDIVLMLVERGARLDPFNLTCLGQVEMVKQLIGLYPQYLKAYGPHGFTLLHHAKVVKLNDFASWIIDQGLEIERYPDIFEAP